MSERSNRWNKVPVALFTVTSLVLLFYWIHWWQIGLRPIRTGEGADLAGFVRWLLGYVFLLAILLGITWINHRVLFRRLVRQQTSPYWLYLGWLLILWWLLFELFQYLNNYTTEIVIENWLVSLLGTVLIAVLTLVFDQPEIRCQQLKLEQEKTEAELRNLRSQLHPHFLFNTLNTIYSEALQRDQDRLAALIGELSGLLRFSFKHNRKDTVTLHEEVDFLQRYVNLQLARLSATQQKAAHIDLSTDALPYRLPPLLIMPFIENVFVHGVHDGTNFYLHIELRVVEGQLVLNIDNSKPATKSTGSTGTGIQNTRERLDLLYQRRYTLEEQQNTDRYHLHLKFPLNTPS